jgi:DNA-binding transcriptional LysR family regulator
MELRQLAYLVGVAEAASFTKAAATLGVAQPGVSAQVRRLEREFGQDLLDRSGRSVRLTEAGAALLPYARAALAAVSGGRLAIDELAGLVRGHVAIGMVTACASLDLTDLVSTFHREYPGVEISLSEANSDRLLQGVADGRLDMAWVGVAGPLPAGIEAQVVADEALIAAVSRGDPLAARVSISVDDLRERTLISLPQGTGLRSCLEKACAARGFEPRVAFEASALHVLAQLASQGLGVAILPESMAQAAGADVRTLAFTSPAPRSRIEFAWRAEGPTSPATRAMINHARNFLARPSSSQQPAS